jgi:Virus neck protein
MTTRLRNYDNRGEQNLLNSLNIESIQAKGIDMWYIVRTLNDFDKIYGQDDQSTFSAAYLLEFYTQNFNGFSGDKDFMGKFGIEIRDQLFLSCSSSRFMDEIGTPRGLLRPRESDLIYFPLYGSVFEIKYVDVRENFYPLGILPTYQLTVELFELSSETFNTGVPEIDAIGATYDLNVFDHAYLDELGNILHNEDGDVLTVEGFQVQTIDPFADSDTLVTNAAAIVSHTETNPFGDVDFPGEG